MLSSVGAASTLLEVRMAGKADAAAIPLDSLMKLLREEECLSDLLLIVTTVVVLRGN